MDIQNEAVDTVNVWSAGALHVSWKKPVNPVTNHSGKIINFYLVSQFFKQFKLKSISFLQHVTASILWALIHVRKKDPKQRHRNKRRKPERKDRRNEAKREGRTEVKDRRKHRKIKGKVFLSAGDWRCWRQQQLPGNRCSHKPSIKQSVAVYTHSHFQWTLC